jgi:hypothetical protein
MARVFVTDSADGLGRMAARLPLSPWSIPQRSDVNIGYANRIRIVVALAALSALCACSTTPRTSSERAADAQLAAQVLAAVRADDAIYAPHIDVEVELGEVHLKGFVYTDAERQLAEADAGAVPGVRAVIMEIGLMGGGISENSN